MADTFTGFTPGGIVFLAGLAADNTRTYFHANRGTYANNVAAPLRALFVAVGERLRDKAVPDVCFELSLGKSLFRINRDTRFSADKTPYHPWVDAIRCGRARRRPPCTGLHLPPQPRLPRGRRRHHGAARHPAPPLPRCRRGRLQRPRPARPAGSTLHHAPRRGDHQAGPQASAATYPLDHPRRDLLRCDALHASVRRPHSGTLASPAFADTLTGLLTPFAQLHRLLVDHVAT